MTIANKIRIRSHYTRSINLERDAQSSVVVDGYIPTTRALQTLERIGATLTTQATPRAWSLLGPYGAGKSAFSAFLSNILAASQAPNHQSALKVLEQSAPSVAARYQTIQQGTQGHCVAALTGSPEPMGVCLARALADAAADFWLQRRGQRPLVIAELQALAKQPGMQTSALIAAITALQEALAQAGANGLLIVIDELGKFLEYEARHYGANDIFLLQALAEQASVAHHARMTVIVLLHQAMEQYARGLTETLRNEWAKVQGRFESVPFIETSEQVLRVVAAAFEHDFTVDEAATVRAQAAEMSKVLEDARALPPTLDAEAATDLFTRCYPLHPLSAMLLPTLCQKVAQNERTLFSYLGSREPHGLADSMQRLAAVGDWVLPWEIYEYFILNQPAAVSDHYTRRRWVEVVTAVERLGDAPEADIRLLKSIGLLNIVGAQGGLKASREVVRLLADTPRTAAATARRLQQRSVLQYRKFSSEYRVWEGSDFDLDAAVVEQVERLGRFNLAQALNKRHALEPVVARRHSIETGTLRFFEPVFADTASFRRLPEQGDEPRIIFFLASSQSERDRFADEVLGQFGETDILVECPDADRLRQTVAEVLALEAVQREAQALNTDPVAQREFKERYAAVVTLDRELLRALAEDPAGTRWYWQGEPLQVSSKRGLQAALSHVLDRVYYAAPVVSNELINRDKLSSQGAAARNRLLAAMLHHQEQPGLGIEKYPPERSVSMALLEATGIHQQRDGCWRFGPPPADEKHFRFRPVWDRIEAFFLSSEASPRSLAELDAILTARPYGLKRGPLTVLYVAVFLAHEHEVALFEEGRYTPYLTDDQLERLVRRPGDFAIQSFQIAGLRASLFREYAAVILGKRETEASVLALARPLATFFADLPEFTKKTKRISPTAQTVRSAFSLAKTPHRLLFETLPEACGVSSLVEDQPSEEELRRFSERLKEALRELKHTYPQLLTYFQDLFAQAFGLERIDSLEALRAVLHGRLEGLERYTIDVDGLRAFIRRTVKSVGSDDEWFANLLLFLGQKPAKKWTDADAEAAEFRLAEFARRIHDLEKLRVHYNGIRQRSDADFDVVLLRTVRKGSAEADEVVCIDERTRRSFAEAKAAFQQQLSALPDRNVRLAVLAELVEELLEPDSVNAAAQPQKDGVDDPNLQAIGGSDD